MSLSAKLTHRLASGPLGRTARRAMADIDSAGTFGVLGKELSGINLPRIINVRGMGERLDTAVLELGNSAGSFGGMAVLNWVTDKFFRTGLKDKAAWVFGKSVFLNSTMFAYLFAMPFFRNHITAMREGTTRFADVIGSNDGSSAQSQEDFKRKDERYLNTGLAVVGSGLAIGLAGLARGAVQAKKGAPFAVGNIAKYWRKNFNYKGGHFKNMTTPSALVFWAASTYTGWIASARDKYERVEAGIKFANFFVMFYLLDVAIQKVLGTAKTYNKAIISHMKKHYTGRSGLFKKINFSQDNMKATFKALGYDAKTQSKYLKIWGAHRMLGYAGSAAGLFISNWVANNISMAATAKRVKQQRETHGKQLMTNLLQADWHSPVL